jgi:hypothetical protein
VEKGPRPSSIGACDAACWQVDGPNSRTASDLADSENTGLSNVAGRLRGFDSCEAVGSDADRALRTWLREESPLCRRARSGARALGEG